MRKLLLLALLVFAATTVAEEASDLILRGDAFDEKFEAKQALEFYLPAEKLRPDDAELLVKIARQYVYRINDFGSKSDKVESAQTALGYARRAVRADPRSADAHLSVAICLGKWSQLEGSREKVEASTDIKTAAEKAVELAPNDGLAWHLLGRWHQALAGLSGFTRGLAKLLYGGLPPASFADAEKCFQKAIALEPNRLMHHIELGRTYAEMGKPDEARKFIQAGLAMPNREFDDPETKDRGRKTLAELE